MAGLRKQDVLFLVLFLISNFLPALGIKEQAFHYFSEFIRITALTDSHPETKRILETKVFAFEDRPFAISSMLRLEDSQIFYFTNIFKGPKNRHDMVIMFAKNRTNLYVPRLLYKSRSNGGWRSCPKIERISGLAYFSKGLRVHYTQETKPVEEILLHLEQVSQMPYRVFNLSEKSYDKIEKLFDSDFFIDPELKTLGLKTHEGVYSYDDEIFIYQAAKESLLDQFQNCQPGMGFKSRATFGLKDEELSKVTYLNHRRTKSFYEYFKGLKYPRGFLPDFSLPALRSYQFNHTLLGVAKIIVYQGMLDGKEIEWHFAYDQKGRVWIDRINFKARHINSYGVESLVIDSGLLTNKPLEYALQADLLWDIEELSPKKAIKFFIDEDEEEIETVDLSPLLDTLEPIQQFRSRHGIERSY